MFARFLRSEATIKISVLRCSERIIEKEQASCFHNSLVTTITAGIHWVVCAYLPVKRSSMVSAVSMVSPRDIRRLTGERARCRPSRWPPLVYLYTAVRASSAVAKPSFRNRCTEPSPFWGSWLPSILHYKDL